MMLHRAWRLPARILRAARDPHGRNSALSGDGSQYQELLKGVGGNSPASWSDSNSLSPWKISAGVAVRCQTQLMTGKRPCSRMHYGSSMSYPG